MGIRYDKYTDLVLNFRSFLSKKMMSPSCQIPKQNSILRFVTEQTFSRSVTKPNPILLLYLTGEGFIYRMDEVRTANFKPDQYNVETE